MLSDFGTTTLPVSIILFGFGDAQREYDCPVGLQQVSVSICFQNNNHPTLALAQVPAALPCTDIQENPMTSMKRPEDIPLAFQSAWNAHDMPAFGALFHEDATFVNRFGHYVRGVDAIVRLHAPIHATIYSDSTLENELVDVIPIGDDAAVVHFWSRLTAGAAHPAGAHAVDTLILAVLTRQGSAWRIKALENVTLTNPRTGEAVLREHSSF